MISWLLLSVGCVVEPEEAPLRPDVLLITLDTTRADRIGAHGYDGAATSNLDALAQRGRRYAAAFTTAPLTIPAHGSIFTGRYPAELGIRANGDSPLQPEERTLAEQFRGAGYDTAASVGAFVTTREWGFDQGFRVYRDGFPRGGDLWHAERPAEAVVDDLRAALAKRRGDKPVFAWAHLYDPHAPFVAGPPWLDEVDGRPYDAEIAYVDDQIGRLLESFDLDRTLVVVVGDHGEGLGERDELSHGLYVYDGVIRVPWIIAGPGVEAEVVEQAVSLVDVAPTVLALAGVDGLPRATGRVVPGTEAPIYVESWQLAQRFGVAPHRAVIADGHQLIDLPRPELYRLDRPDQDIAAAEPGRVAALKARLDAFGFEAPRTDPAHPVPPARIRQLEALGYVQGGVIGQDGPLPDPKDRREFLAKVQLRESLVQQGRMEEADRLLAELAGAHAEIVELQMLEARRLARTGNLDEAVSVVRRLLEADADNAVAIHLLGSLLARRGEFGEAARRFHEAADRMPWAPRLRVMAVAAMFEAEGGGEPGLELARAYLMDTPDDPGLAGVLGVELVRRGQMEQGLPLLERGLRGQPPEPDVAWLLAAAATGRGDHDRAEDLLRLELRHHPANVRAEIALLASLGRRGAWQDQVDEADRWLAGPGSAALHARAPGVVDLLRVRAQALFNLKRYAEARVAVDGALALGAGDPELLLLDANLLHQEGAEPAARVRFEQARAARAASEAATAGSAQDAPSPAQVDP